MVPGGAQWRYMAGRVRSDMQSWNLGEAVNGPLTWVPPTISTRGCHQPRDGDGQFASEIYTARSLSARPSDIHTPRMEPAVYSILSCLTGQILLPRNGHIGG
jgi:hypothetical protein